MQSILLVRTSAIGDVIQTLPVLQYLHARFPEAKIEWVVEKGIAPLLNQVRIEGKKVLSRVLSVNTKQWSSSPLSSQSVEEMKIFSKELRAVDYDLLFDLQGNIKSALVTSLARAKEKVGFGWNSVREKPNVLATSQRFDLPLGINIRHKYLGLVQRYFKEDIEETVPKLSFELNDKESERLEAILSEAKLQSPLRLMIATGSKWKNKQLSSETLLNFLKKIASLLNPSFLFIYGGEEEKLLAKQLSSHFPDRSEAIGSLSLPLWQSLMGRVDGVIAVDSAALHFAGTTSTPSFSLFGPTQASIFKPMGKNHHAFQGKCPYGRAFDKQCPILRTCSTGACIRALDEAELFRQFQEWSELLVSSSL